MKNNKNQLTEEALQIILNRLSIEHIEDVAEMDFLEGEITRNSVKKYIQWITGSIRLRKLKFYNRFEYLKRIDHITSLKLP